MKLTEQFEMKSGLPVLDHPDLTKESLIVLQTCRYRYVSWRFTQNIGDAHDQKMLVSIWFILGSNTSTITQLTATRPIV